jgi:short-subunit dehydrogenase
MSDLQGRVMVITGASAGIGAALAQAAAGRGARLVLAARRAERLAQAAAGLGREVLTVTADVTSAQDRVRLKEATLARFGRVDVLVNNAGAGAYGLFLESTEAQWRALFEVDLFAPLALTQAFLPVLLAQGQGLIVNVASVAGLMAHAPKEIGRAHV